MLIKGYGDEKKDKKSNQIKDLLFLQKNEIISEPTERKMT